MEFRSAALHDLPQLKAVYRDIIQNMDRNQIQIWDDVYPCDHFEEDIQRDRLYVLVEHTEIVSAFALSSSHPGEKAVEWAGCGKSALYLDRFGVNVNYLRKGIGSFMLVKAKETAKSRGADYLRLFVVNINEPAINLYRKNGFTRAAGVYDEIIDEDFVLHEFGYEAEL